MLNFLMCLAILCGVLGMFQFGYNNASINAPQKHIQQFIIDSFLERYGLVIDEENAKTYLSFAVAIRFASGCISGLSSSFWANKFGRRKSLLLCQVFCILGAISSGFCKVASSYELLLIGRFLYGISDGLLLGLGPLYLSEITPAAIRGSVATAGPLAFAAGVLVSVSLGYKSCLGNEHLWPALIAVNGATGILQACFLLFVPESPKYLVFNLHDKEAAKTSLLKLRNGDILAIEDELDTIISASNATQSKEPMSMLNLVKNEKLRLPVFLCVILSIGRPMTGIGAMLFYSTNFFEMAGIDQESCQFATIGVGAIIFVMTLVTIPLMDKLGRRALFLGGSIGQIICHIILTAALVLHSKQMEVNNRNTGTESESLNPIGITLILGALLFLAMHAIGPSPVPFIAPGDLFDNEPKAAASSLSASVTWIGMLTVALTFPLCQRYLKAFMVVPFVVVIVCQIVPFYFYFPETKGMSNSKIASLFQIENPWRHAIGLRSSSQSFDISHESSANDEKEESPRSSVETLSISTISSFNHS